MFGQGWQTFDTDFHWFVYSAIRWRFALKLKAGVEHFNTLCGHLCTRTHAGMLMFACLHTSDSHFGALDVFVHILQMQELLGRVDTLKTRVEALLVSTRISNPSAFRVVSCSP